MPRLGVQALGSRGCGGRTRGRGVPGCRRSSVSGLMISPAPNLCPSYYLADWCSGTPATGHWPLAGACMLFRSELILGSSLSPPLIPCSTPGAYTQGKIICSPRFCLLWTVNRLPINIYRINIRIDSGCGCMGVCTGLQAVPSGTGDPQNSCNWGYRKW